MQVKKYLLLLCCPNLILMRIIYFTLILLLPFFVSAQSPSFDQDPAIQEVKFDLYPNPAFDKVVYITTDVPGPKEIAIFDVFGKLVLQQAVRESRLDISKLDPGVYMVQLKTNSKNVTRKLIVK